MKKTTEKSIFIQQLISFLLVVLIAISIYDYFDVKKVKVKKDKAIFLSSDYCTLIRPSGWKGRLIGETFAFRSKIGSIILFEQFQSPNCFFSAVNKDKHINKKVINDLIKTLGTKFSEIEKLTLQPTTFSSYFPAVKFQFLTKKHSGMGTIFYSHDIRFIYLALQKKDDKRDNYITHNFINYVKLKPPYDTPIYTRPVISFAPVPDKQILIKKVNQIFQEANYLWLSATDSPNNVTQALKLFEKGMKIIATNSLGNVFTLQHDSLIKLYNNLKQYRKYKINKIKSDIIQSKTLNNIPLAKELTKELIALASLDSECEIRAWAKHELNNLSKRSK